LTKCTHFHKNIEIPHLTIEEIINKEWSVDHLKYSFLFDEYLKGGNMPFYLDINYLKSKRGGKIPDYYISDNENSFIVEIGGKGKGREQFKGVDEKKQLILTHSERMDGIRRPLFLAGFLTTK
jgi:hypothetical protein